MLKILSSQYLRGMSFVYNHNTFECTTKSKCLIKILSRKYVNFKFDHFRASLIHNTVHDFKPL